MNKRRAKSVTGRPGDPNGSSGSSNSSSFSSSAYSSTISSHLSGDEDKEKHHITDVYKDEVEVERMNLNQIIEERDSENSSRLESRRKTGSRRLTSEARTTDRRSQSLNVHALSTSAKVSSPHVSPQN